MERSNRIISIEGVLQRAQALCAKQEKCSADMRLKLAQWGVPKNSAEEIIAKLKKDQFLDDSRFAGIFVREKSRINKWGSIKILQALRIKGITEKIITEALSQVDMKTEEESLYILMSKKVKSTKSKSSYELGSKLIKYALSKGYNYEVACKVASRITKAE